MESGDGDACKRIKTINKDKEDSNNIEYGMFYYFFYGIMRFAITLEFVP